MTFVLKLGVIGLGMSFNRVVKQEPEIFDLPIRFTAAADPREQALETFREEFGGATYTNVEELCQSSAVDAVYIASPSELHCQHTLMAAENGKHVIVEKPFAMSLEEAEKMNAAAERYGIKLLTGHTHSFDAPILEMREIIREEELGKLISINTWNFNEFNYRPWPSQELRTTNGPILNQGPHQVDIVRQIGGGLVHSVRASTVWDPIRQCEGGYNAHVEFEDGVGATLVYDARGFFDTAELFWWVGELGWPREPSTNSKMRENLLMLPEKEREDLLEGQKEQLRYGGVISDWPEVWKLWWQGQGEKNQQFFGLTVVNCERGAIRQSPNGLYIYGDRGRTERPITPRNEARAAEIMELYEGILHDRPIFHDGRWGQATLEVCLGIIESARQRKEVIMNHQVPVGD